MIVNPLRDSCRRHRVLLSFASIVSFLFAGALSAHEQKTAVTRILFNSNTNNIEVMHRFLIHDAEHAAGQIFGVGQDLLQSAESRELFSSYVINRFSLAAEFTSGESSQLELAYVGAEVDGQFLWVYQETSALNEVAAFTMVNMALRDVWPDQSNLVNVEKEGEVFSILFDGGAEVKTLELGS
ncbi:MAG: DUF6702 family protein [Pseudohongiellaceae bacterium]